MAPQQASRGIWGKEDVGNALSRPLPFIFVLKRSKTFFVGEGELFFIWVIYLRRWMYVSDILHYLHINRDIQTATFIYRLVASLQEVGVIGVI